MSPAKALRRALARTADVLWDLPLVTQGVSQEILDQDGCLDLLVPGTLLILLDGPGGGIGLVSVDRQLMTGLIEVQTISQVTRVPIEDRPLTPTDAAMMAPLIDGGLARFHGGGRGAEGWLDHALATAKIKTRQPDGLSMGYARLSAGRTSVIVDASPPPGGAASFNAHASTLAFELTSGRRPLVVNCGPGDSFGADWRRAGRATPSHSGLSLGGYSSARLAEPDRHTGAEALIECPTYVPVEIGSVGDGTQFQGAHNGYVAGFGLTHARSLELTHDGRGLAGEDMLLAIEPAEKRVFDREMDAVKLAGIPFEIRFHLHPDVDATVDLGGAAISMAQKSGEIWVFRHDGTHKLSLEPSVYLERNRLKPRASVQILLSGRVVDYASRVRWSLSKAQETAIGVRDLSLDDPYDDQD